MTDYFEPESNDIKQVEHNSGILQIYRLDSLWQKATQHATTVNYIKWNEDLDRAWVELSPLMDEPEKIAIKEIDKKVKESWLYGLSSALRQKNPTLYGKMMSRQKYLLQEKEMLLRKFEDKYGKGAKYKTDEDDWD